MLIQRLIRGQRLTHLLPSSWSWTGASPGHFVFVHLFVEVGFMVTGGREAGEWLPT